LASSIYDLAAAILDVEHPTKSQDCCEQANLWWFILQDRMRRRSFAFGIVDGKRAALVDRKARLSTADPPHVGRDAITASPKPRRAASPG
jgi:hypothetical protein